MILQYGMDALFRDLMCVVNFCPNGILFVRVGVTITFMQNVDDFLAFTTPRQFLDEFIAHPSVLMCSSSTTWILWNHLPKESNLALHFYYLTMFLYGKHQRHYESPKLVFLILFCCYIRTRGFLFARVLGREHWLTVLTWVLGRTECTERGSIKTQTCYVIQRSSDRLNWAFFSNTTGYLHLQASGLSNQIKYTVLGVEMGVGLSTP